MPGTETSPVLGLPFWAGPQAAPWLVENEVARAFEALHRGSVLDRDLTAPPGTCDDGAAYLVGGSATGAWATHDGEMAIAKGTDAVNGWIFLPVATEGKLLYIEDEAILIQYISAAWVEFSAGGGAYDFGFAFEATPGADAILGRVRIGRNITLPANLAGAFGGGDVDPDATYDIDVRDDGVSIGTISIADTGTITWTTDAGTSKAVAAGSEVTFVGQTTPDTSIQGWSFVLAATQD